MAKAKMQKIDEGDSNRGKIVPEPKDVNDMTLAELEDYRGEFLAEWSADEALRNDPELRKAVELELEAVGFGCKLLLKYGVPTIKNLPDEALKQFLQFGISVIERGQESPKRTTSFVQKKL